jgi:hypothetical protein
MFLFYKGEKLPHIPADFLSEQSLGKLGLA